MSHKTEVKTKLNNLTYLTKGLDKMGIKYTVKEGGELRTRGQYNVHEKVDILIHEVNGKSTNDAIGFQKTSDGTYTAIGDFWGTGISAQNLRNDATTEAKKEEVNDRLMQLGFSLDTTTVGKQDVELTFSRWS